MSEFYLRASVNGYGRRSAMKSKSPNIHLLLYRLAADVDVGEDRNDKDFSEVHKSFQRK